MTIHQVAGLLLWVFEDWKSGVQQELQVYQSRGHSLYEIVLRALVYLAVEFYPELLDLRRGRLLEQEQPQSASTPRTTRRARRNKRGQLVLVDAGDDDDASANSLLVHQGSALNFFTPPASPERPPKEITIFPQDDDSTVATLPSTYTAEINTKGGTTSSIHLHKEPPKPPAVDKGEDPPPLPKSPFRRSLARDTEMPTSPMRPTTRRPKPSSRPITPSPPSSEDGNQDNNNNNNNSFLYASQPTVSEDPNTSTTSLIHLTDNLVVEAQHLSHHHDDDEQQQQEDSHHHSPMSSSSNSFTSHRRPSSSSQPLEDHPDHRPIRILDDSHTSTTTSDHHEAIPIGVDDSNSNTSDAFDSDEEHEEAEIEEQAETENDKTIIQKEGANKGGDDLHQQPGEASAEGETPAPLLPPAIRSTIQHPSLNIIEERLRSSASTPSHLLSNSLHAARRISQNRHTLDAPQLSALVSTLISANEMDDISSSSDNDDDSMAEDDNTDKDNSKRSGDHNDSTDIHNNNNNNDDDDGSSSSSSSSSSEDSFEAMQESFVCDSTQGNPDDLDDSLAPTLDFMRRRADDETTLGGESGYGIVPNSELEKVALALKTGVKTLALKKKKKKRRRRLRKGKKKKQYENSFSGSAAVDFLSQYLKKPRWEALQVGRQIAQKYNLFIKCGASKKKKKRSDKLNRAEAAAAASSAMFDTSGGSEDDLDDSARETGIHPATGKKLKSTLLRDHRKVYYRFFAYLPSEAEAMTLEQKMRIFEEEIRVRNVRRGRKRYKHCFRGKDACNLLARRRLVPSREEATNLCQRFILEFNMFEPVNRQGAFRDSSKSFYRFIDKNARYFSIDNDFSTRLVEFQGNAVDWDSHLGANGDGFEEDLFWKDKPDVGDLDSIGEEGESDDDVSESSSSASEVEHELITKDHQYLCEVAEVLERGIQLKKDGTFTASKACTFMITCGLVDTRTEAQILGRRLEREFNLFHSVTGKHDFGDSGHAFRFTDKAERHEAPVKIQVPLEEIAATFEQGVKVKDYSRKVKTYKNTFVGIKAVDFLVNSGLASNRLEAVRIGRQLVERYNLFGRVTGRREFSDDYDLFRFTPPEERRAPEPEDQKGDVRSSTTRLVEGITIPENTLVGKSLSGGVLEFAEWFLTGVKIKDNKFRAKTYPKTFVGTDGTLAGPHLIGLLYLGCYSLLLTCLLALF